MRAPSKKTAAKYQAGKSLVILALALALLIAQSIFFLYKGNQISEREAQQEKSGVILLRLREVLSDLQDAETGQRGYLLTGSEIYLEPYQRASGAIDTHLHQAQTLLASDPKMTARLAALEIVIAKKLRELDETIQLRRAGNPDAALARVRDGTGKIYMDQVRVILGNQLDEVRASRTIINHEIAAQIRTAEYVLVSIALTIIIMVTLATTQMMRVIQRNEELSRRLADESTHDDLTHLPNRRLFFTWLDKTLHHAKRKNAKAAVLFIDLDGFKFVNDHFGHASGDKLLCTVAERFSGTLRSADLLVRFGGDEFAILVSEDVSTENLTAIAQRLADSLSSSALLSHIPDHAIGASIGIAIYPENGIDADALVRSADKAMYQAKHAGKGQFCFSDGVV